MASRRTAANSPREGMKPDDIGRIRQAEAPRVSPDGKAVAFTVVDMDLAANRYRRRIWLADLDSGRSPRPFSPGPDDQLPRWSPDGQWLAFAVNPKHGPAQLCVLPAWHGGERVVVATWPEHLSELEWSPDGSRLAFVARVPDAERYGPPGTEAREEDMPPRRVARLFSRLDSEGWVVDRPLQVMVVEADGSSEPRTVTDGPYQAFGISWSPDGSRLAFASSRHDTWDLDGAVDLWVLDVAGAPLTPERLTGSDAAYSFPVWSPDGKRLAYLVTPTPKDLPRHSQLGVLELATGTLTNLTADLDRNCNPYGYGRAPVWTGSDLLCSVEDGGNVHIYSIAASGHGKPQPVVDGERWVSSWDWSAGTLAMVVSNPTSFPELFTRSFGPSIVGTLGGKAGAPEPGPRRAGRAGAGRAIAASASGPAQAGTTVSAGSGPRSGVHVRGEVLESNISDDVEDKTTERQLTSVSAAFKASVQLAEPVAFVARSADGTEVPCWAVPPVGAVEGKRYPTLLNVHGGPFTSYGNRFFDEFQVQAGAGFGVLYCNPRGSSGYEESWGRAVRWPEWETDPGSGWGGVDFDDIMACAEQGCRQFGWADPARLGILGGSYGGYMTSWAIGHTDRFKAACSERACNNLLALEANSDIASSFRGYTGVNHLDGAAAYLRQSPITYVKEMKTPVLILHSEKDLRCPINQAEELFVALRLLGRDPVFVRFPGESHELSRSGSPKHRVVRARLILEWFEEKLA